MSKVYCGIIPHYKEWLIWGYLVLNATNYELIHYDMEIKNTTRYGLFGGGDMIHYGTMEEMLARGKEMASAKADVCYAIGYWQQKV